MQPQFQSSFIPKGPVSSGVTSSASQSRRGPTDLFSFLAGLVFALSIVLAGGVFLYKLYLNYDIGQMKEELESARAALEPETVNELIRLNTRLVSTETLLRNHKIVSPLFDFLEASTPKTVRYTDFNLSHSLKGSELVLQGQARSYAALAAAAAVFDQATNYFANAIFSDLKLDDKGNVVFTLKTDIKPEALSYENALSLMPPENVGTVSTTTAGTASSSPANSGPR